jgi:hypothetical protein
VSASSMHKVFPWKSELDIIICISVSKVVIGMMSEVDNSSCMPQIQHSSCVFVLGLLKFNLWLLLIITVLTKLSMWVSQQIIFLWLAPFTLRHSEQKFLGSKCLYFNYKTNSKSGKSYKTLLNEDLCWSVS